MTVRNAFLGTAAILLIVAAPLVRYSIASTETRNFRAVRPGTLYRSGQMSENGFRRTLEEYKIKTVISFRDARDSDKPSPDEFETEMCKDRGVAYHRLTPLKWSAPDGSVPATANATKFLELVKTAPRPIIVHCFAGIHRTGAYVALYRMECEGWSNADAIAEMLEIGSRRSTFEDDQLQFLERFKPSITP